MLMRKKSSCPLFVLVLLLLLIPSDQAFADDPVYEDDDIVVTASRYDQQHQMNVTNITNDELKYREPDMELPMLLQSLPGVFAYSDAGLGMGYTYLKIRGFDQRRVGVLFNGIPMNDPEDHQIWWVDLPDLAGSIEDIQVQRGITNSVGGMTAIGGTVNLVSAGLRAESEGRVSLNTGSYGFARQSVICQTGELKGGFRSMFHLSHQESDGYRDRSGHEGTSFFWSGQYETANTTTRVNIYSGKELTHHAWDAVPQSILETDRTANMETYANAVDSFRQPHYEVHHTAYLSDNVSMTNRAYYIQGLGYYENYKDDRTAADYSLDQRLGLDPEDEVDLIRQKWVRKDHVGWVPSLSYTHDKGRLLVGGDWYTFHSNHWGEVLWTEGYTPGDFTDPHKYHNYTGDKDTWSIYASERYEVADGLTLTGDLHYQHKNYRFEQREVGNFSGDQLNGYTVKWDFFNPKGAIKWQVPGRVVGGRLQTYGSVGINHREPTDNELFDTWAGGDDLGAKPLFAHSRNVLNADDSIAYVEWYDPYVKEEKVVDYELGFSWQNERLSFTLGGYWMDFTNEIVPYGGVNDDGSSIRGNAGKTLHRGVELGLRANIDANNALSIAASRSWDKFDDFLFHDWDGSVYDYSGNPIALFPEHLLMVSWDTDWQGAVRSRIRVRNTGKQYLDNSGNDDRTIDAWGTVDLSLWLDLAGVGLDAFDGATAFVHARNISDAKYEVWGYYYGENYYTPAAGRNFVFGLDYDF